MADEFERIAQLTRVLAVARPELVPVGIGDDATVLVVTEGRLVWTIDAQVEEVHFRRSWLGPEDIGFRATVAAASDVLAMGAQPLSILAAWTVAEGEDDETMVRIAVGQRQAADRLGAAVDGGNLSRGPMLSLTTTVLGRVERPIARPIERGGARPGDWLVAVGSLGHAALGLAALAQNRADEALLMPMVETWRRPPILRTSGVHLAVLAKAMVDVSDGLAQDVGHLATASRVSAVIDVARLAARRTDAARLAAQALGLDILSCELSGGEDYALVAAVAPDEPLPEGAEPIGFIEPASPEGEGAVWIQHQDGRRVPAPAGHRHR